MRSRRLRCERVAARAGHGINVTVPWKMGGSVQWNERGSGNSGRHLTPEPERHGAVVATVHHRCRCPDTGKTLAYVQAIDEAKQRRRGLGGGRLSLQPGEAF